MKSLKELFPLEKLGNWTMSAYDAPDKVWSDFVHDPVVRAAVWLREQFRNALGWHAKNAWAYCVDTKGIECVPEGLVAAYFHDGDQFEDLLNMVQACRPSTTDVAGAQGSGFKTSASYLVSCRKDYRILLYSKCKDGNTYVLEVTLEGNTVMVKDVTTTWKPVIEECIIGKAEDTGAETLDRINVGYLCYYSLPNVIKDRQILNTHALRALSMLCPEDFTKIRHTYSRRDDQLLTPGDSRKKIEKGAIIHSIAEAEFNRRKAGSLMARQDEDEEESESPDRRIAMEMAMIMPGLKTYEDMFLGKHVGYLDERVKISSRGNRGDICFVVDIQHDLYGYPMESYGSSGGWMMFRNRENMAAVTAAHEALGVTQFAHLFQGSRIGKPLRLRQSLFIKDFPLAVKHPEKWGRAAADAVYVTTNTFALEMLNLSCNKRTYRPVEQAKFNPQTFCDDTWFESKHVSGWEAGEPWFFSRPPNKVGGKDTRTIREPFLYYTQTVTNIHSVTVDGQPEDDEHARLVLLLGGLGSCFFSMDNGIASQFMTAAADHFAAENPLALKQFRDYWKDCMPSRGGDEAPIDIFDKEKERLRIDVFEMDDKTLVKSMNLGETKFVKLKYAKDGVPVTGLMPLNPAVDSSYVQTYAPADNLGLDVQVSHFRDDQWIITVPVDLHDADGNRLDPSEPSFQNDWGRGCYPNRYITVKSAVREGKKHTLNLKIVVPPYPIVRAGGGGDRKPSKHKRKWWTDDESNPHIFVVRAGNGFWQINLCSTAGQLLRKRCPNFEWDNHQRLTKACKKLVEQVVDEANSAQARLHLMKIDKFDVGTDAEKLKLIQGFGDEQLGCEHYAINYVVSKMFDTNFSETAKYIKANKDRLEERAERSGKDSPDESDLDEPLVA